MVNSTNICPHCKAITEIIPVKDWEKYGIKPKAIPSWGVPQICENQHLSIRDGRNT